MNVLHITKTEHIKTVQESYSDDVYEKIPFTADPKLSKDDLENRLCEAIYKRFPPKHVGGCGYSCSIREFHRESPTSGYIVIKHYHGIGD